MTFEVVIEPDTEDYERLKQLIETGGPVIMKVDAPWSEPLFVHGDRVQVAFDDGWGPATVEGTSTYMGDELVQVSYGPRGKYRTSLSRAAVRTDRRREYPARVEVTI